MLGSTLSAALSCACAPPGTDGDTESAGSSTSSAGECSATVDPFCRSEPIDLAEVAAGMGGFLAGDAVRPLGDVNGDGLDDLGLRDYVVFSELEIAPLLYDETLLSQRGFRVSWASQDAAPEPRAAGDVNGDGLADLLVLHEPMGRAWIIFGKADLTPVDLSEVESGIGGFVVTEVGGVASVPPLGDVDGDGLGDLAFSTSSLEETRVIRGKADGDLVALGSDALLTVPGVARIAAGDFDGDGVVDLALCGPTLEILSAPGGWQSPMLHTTALGYTCGLGGLFQGGDFDVDGHDDLAFDAIVDAVGTAILFGPVVTEGEPPGEADLSKYFVSTYGAALADLDGDGDSEVIVARDDDDGSSIWTWKIEDQKTPTECMPPQDRLYGPGKAAWVDVVGDLDGDGRDDLFESHSSVVITRVCSEVK